MCPECHFFVSESVVYLRIVGVFQCGLQGLHGDDRPRGLALGASHSYTIEKVGEAEDCFGIRFSMVVFRDEDRFKVFEATAANKLTPSSHLSKSILECAKRMQDKITT